MLASEQNWCPSTFIKKKHFVCMCVNIHNLEIPGTANFHKGEHSRASFRKFLAVVSSPWTGQLMISPGQLLLPSQYINNEPTVLLLSEGKDT